MHIICTARLHQCKCIFLPSVCMCVCVSPFLLSLAPPLQHNPKSALLAVHKMDLHLWPDATSIHLVGFDRIYKVTAARHSAKSTDIAAIMVNICYSWSPLSQGNRYRCHHSKYLLLPIDTHNGLSIAAIHGKYWGSSFCRHHSVAMVILPSHIVFLFITAPPLPSRGSVTVQGLS